ncbi:MAG: asparagine synthase (glutamine-hydrolyzing) [Geobacteraceae bacterium]|nr:asparagine synthase (glutamine-hydrolyzing) [Geobacteraceae bacterium]
MCGIAGFIDFKRQTGLDSMQETVRRMSDALIHRGPDDGGVWCDAATGVALGHRRLAIIDLSPAGHQPMLSAGGRYVLVFNGEVYNHREIRRELDRLASPPVPWRGHSDTEVMLAAFEAWGVEGSVKRFTGMFAFALLDRKERRLHLVRDRLGEKPLYYGWSGKTFLFGSELKALRAYSGFNNEINRDAIALYLRHNCIPAPHSIYRGVFKLLPGTVLTIDCTGEPGPGAIPRPYWQARAVAEAGVAAPFPGSEKDAVAQLDGVLREAVNLQMTADVPLGAFLSGGIDSSTIVALMQAQSPRPVKTFTIGFQEQRYNEAEHARAVARQLGTEHTELYVTPADALAVIPRLPSLYDEPFSDSSQIPTFLVARMTRTHVTVSLSGDGGDELFAGYTRHYLGRDIWRKAELLPGGVRRLLGGSLLAVSPDRWNSVYRFLAPSLPSRFQVPVPGHSIHKLAEIISARSPEEMYYRLVSHWMEPAAVVRGAEEPLTVVTDAAQWPSLDDFAQKMMYLDTMTYLPDDILVKVDRAAMGVSLETRIPFLDHRVVEFAWRLPLSMKIRDGQGKWILRQVLDRYLPRELYDRPKGGFGVPIDAWLRGPLREWAEALLDERRLRSEGFLNPEPIRRKWEQHLSGDRNWHYHLWDVLMFQAWLDAQ